MAISTNSKVQYDDKQVFESKLLIVGSGPAGYTAAVYAARANLNPVLITGLELGGQLNSTTDVDNWPGAFAGIQGPELMDNMLKHAERFGTQIINDVINEVDLLNKPITLISDEKKYICDALIIATGASHRKLAIADEDKFSGKGLSYCATCDGFFYKNMTVAVIGGGNSALTEALYLSRIAKKVILIHRRNIFKAEQILIDQIRQKQVVNGGNVEILYNSVVEEILSDQQNTVSGVLVKNLDKNNANSSDNLLKIDLQGIFVAIGLIPNTKIFENQLNMRNGYIIVKSGIDGYATRTSVDGVFAAGDVADSAYRQAVTSAATGCMAALDAEKFLQEKIK